MYMWMGWEEKRKEGQRNKAGFNDVTVQKKSPMAMAEKPGFDSQHISDDCCLGDRNIKLNTCLLPLLTFSIFNLYNANTHIFYEYCARKK